MCQSSVEQSRECVRVRAEREQNRGVQSRAESVSEQSRAEREQSRAESVCVCEREQRAGVVETEA